MQIIGVRIGNKEKGEIRGSLSSKKRSKKNKKELLKKVFTVKILDVQCELIFKKVLPMLRNFLGRNLFIYLSKLRILSQLGRPEFF